MAKLRLSYLRNDRQYWLSIDDDVTRDARKDINDTRDFSWSLNCLFGVKYNLLVQFRIETESNMLHQCSHIHSSAFTIV